MDAAADLFLSYAREDEKFAADLAGELQGRGWTLWWDTALLPGDPFALQIETCLRAAKAVLVLWSKASVRSMWVNNEARDAMGRRVLIPARIEEVHLPIEFNGLHTVDLTDWHSSSQNHPQFEAFVSAIERLAEPGKRPVLISVQRDIGKDAQLTQPDVPVAEHLARLTVAPSERPVEVGGNLKQEVASLERINLEMGRAQNGGDVEFFEGLLASEFVMQRANGALMGRKEFLSDLRPGGDRTTQIEGIEFPQRNLGIVNCLLIAGGRRFRSLRTFIRVASGWRLISWANEPDWAAA